MSAKVHRIVTWGAAIVMPLGLAAVLSAWPPLVAEVSQPQGIGQRTVYLPAGGTAEQTFVATDDHIDAVGVLVLTPGGGNGAITFSVRPAAGGGQDLVRSAVVRRRRVTPTELVHARFRRLDVRPGDTYVLTVSTDAVMSLGSAGRDVYPQGELRTFAEKDHNDLIFRVYRSVNGHDLTRRLLGVPAWVAALLVAMGSLVAGWALGLLLSLDRTTP